MKSKKLLQKKGLLQRGGTLSVSCCWRAQSIIISSKVCAPPLSPLVHLPARKNGAKNCRGEKRYGRQCRWRVDTLSVLCDDHWHFLLK
jgi:hypothetical protein